MVEEVPSILAINSTHRVAIHSTHRVAINSTHRVAVVCSANSDNVSDLTESLHMHNCNLLYG